MNNLAKLSLFLRSYKVTVRDLAILQIFSVKKGDRHQVCQDELNVNSNVLNQYLYSLKQRGFLVSSGVKMCALTDEGTKLMADLKDALAAKAAPAPTTEKTAAPAKKSAAKAKK